MQIPLPMQFEPSFALDEFFVNEENKHVYQLIESAQWHGSFLYLQGDKACGKTHLTHIFTQHHQAWLLNENNLNLGFDSLNIDSTNTKKFAVDNIEALSQKSQEALFHLCNIISTSNDLKLLVTGSSHPKKINSILPDLQSRITAFQTISINPPSDQLISQFLRKNFADKKLYPNNDIIKYIMKNSPRGFNDLKKITEKIDEITLAQKSKINKNIASQAIQYINSACS